MTTLRNPLARVVLEAVREALCWCGGSRPDSSRQTKARQRARELKQARTDKAVVITVAPDLPTLYTPPRSDRFSW